VVIKVFGHQRGRFGPGSGRRHLMQGQPGLESQPSPGACSQSCRERSRQLGSMERRSPPVATSPTAASSGNFSSLEPIVRSGVHKLHPLVTQARTVDEQCEEHKACSPQPHLRHDLKGQGRGKQVGGSGHPGCTCLLHNMLWTARGHQQKRMEASWF